MALNTFQRGRCSATDNKMSQCHPRLEFYLVQLFLMLLNTSILSTVYNTDRVIFIM